MEALLAAIDGTTIALLFGWLGIGVIVGALSMMLGIGGGMIMVPAFRLLGRLSAVVSSATSIFVIVPTGVAGVVRHLRAGTCRVPIGLAAGIGGAITSVLGAKLADVAPGWTI
ncbi:MAG: sulfite exporter TauE/SafE family protein, partial [Eggerthellaceae bacterium]|nr:sulfite exporter TauE/SafE family protein [Eggerthellaceae bacterium]